MGNSLNKKTPFDVNAYFKSGRYIVFLIDSKFKQHDGRIFCSYKEAREYIGDCINENWCNKAVIGLFSLDPNAQEMMISKVETIGFTGDKKHVGQLELFKSN